jgi:hypothetical protein
MSNNKQKRNKPTKEELYKNEREQCFLLIKQFKLS